MQLNLEQKKLIQTKPHGHNLIKGVAGSGKTTVAVHKIPFLLKHYCFEPDDSVLLVTYNKTLSNYIEYLYNKVSDEQLDEFQSIFGAGKDSVYIFTIDSIIYRYFLKYKKQNNLKLEVIPNQQEKYLILSNCIAELQKLYNVNILDQKYSQFLLDEIDWIKSCNYLELEEYQNADRLGRMSTQSTDGPQKLLKNSEIRNAIFNLMLLYNKRLEEKDYIDFKDIALLALKQVKERVDEKYTHIIIDESQDLTRVQIEFLKQLYLEKAHSSVTFIADTAQSIYPQSWLVKGRSFTSIGFDMTGKSSSLSKNYRTTTQIAEAAYSLIEKDLNITGDDNFVKASLIDRQGKYPVYKKFKNSQQEINFVIEEIKNNLSAEYQFKDIVIIAKNKNQLNYALEALVKANIPCTLINKQECDFESNKVKLLTMHSIKGLESPVVFIIGLNRGIIPYVSYQDIEDQTVQESNDRKLFYVGMTRASERLFLSSSDFPSKFIDEINPKFLKIDSKSKFRRFYNICIDDYLHKDKILDLYSNEEKVRQWIVKELKDNYKYPLNLIDVEYKLNNFSKTGSVDVVAAIYVNNVKVPYLLVETKALNGGLQSGLEQLKSYMSSSKTCKYGIVTDGNEIVIINSEFLVINDIPSFHYTMLPTSLERYDYLDIAHGISCKIIRDTSNKAEVIVKTDKEESYDEENLTKVTVFGEIAAGIPIDMNVQIEDIFYLPKEWIGPDKETFILKIRGDSMQGAKIEDGDYVLIKKQECAQNRDIVAVDLDGNATLKRYMKMGSTVLLIPENEKYEPIQIRDEQARIIGVAVAIIKKES